MHEKARLGIMTALVVHAGGLTFIELKRLCTLTDGNLSRHLDVLGEAGLIDIAKGVENNRPQTRCRLTTDGRKRFDAYLDAVRSVLQDARGLRPRSPAALPATSRDAQAPSRTRRRTARDRDRDR